MKKQDYVQLTASIDSLFLNKGDRGYVCSAEFDDGYVAIEFDEPFEESHDCEGYVKNGNGWYVNTCNLELVIESNNI